MTSQAIQDEIDAALDDALDELDDEDEEIEERAQKVQSKPSKENETVSQSEQAPKPSKRPVFGPPPPPPKSDIETELEEMTKNLFLGTGDGTGGEGLNNPEEFFNKLVEQMQSQVTAELDQQPTNESKAPKKSPTAKKASPRKQEKVPADRQTHNEVDQTISNLVQDMAQQAQGNMENASNTEGFEEETMKKIMEELDKGMGKDFNADAVLDGMMEQLLSRDMMYPPIKEVTSKFPKWLEEHQDSIPDTEYQQRCKQYECFQKIIQVYETQPENMESLMNLMAEVQEFGQPPKELIAEIAPGLELDEDGVPKMDQKDGMPPFPMGDEECRIM